MPRYVLGDTWWEIERDDALLVIRTGGRDTPPKEQIRRYKTPGHAEIQYDVMIREKVGAGYEQATTPAPASQLPEDDPGKLTELEAAIVADPYGTAVYAVYGDWLQSHGDPRGELIALQLAEDRKPGDERLVTAIGRHLDKHKAQLLGRLAKHAGKLREFADGPFVWRFGVIHIVQLDGYALGESDPPAGVLDELLAHPSGRFVAEISVREDKRQRLAAVIDLLAKKPTASLRALELASESEFGNLEPVLAAHPRLRRLAVRGRIGGNELTPMRETLRSIQKAPLPELEELELRLVNRDARLAYLTPLLRRSDLPALTRLRLRSADSPTELIAELVESPFASQLAVLDLGLCEVGDRGIGLLVEHADRFANLQEVVVMRGEASKSALARLEEVAKKVTFFDHDPDDDDRDRDDDYFDEIEE